MSSDLRVGDLVTATFRGDPAQGDAFTVVGRAYEIERYPDHLWVGSQIVVFEGDTAPAVIHLAVMPADQVAAR